jgi:hypothetical protein
MHKILSVLSTLLLLSACGGGGGSNSAAPPPDNSGGTPVTPNQFTPIATSVELDIYGDKTAGVNDTIGLAVLPNRGAKLVDVRWQQTSGPAVDLISPHTPVIGFIAPVASTYEFRVEARVCSTDNNNSCVTNLTSTDVSINVSAASKAANIRLDHAAVEGGRVSFRVDPSTSADITSVTWTVGNNSAYQTFAIDLESQENRVFFDAPRVDQDTVFEINADITLSSGTTLTETALLGVRNAEIDEAQGYFPRYSGNIVTENMFPANSDSPYADDLKYCIYSNTLNESCRFSRLPLIGMEFMTPSVEDIMDRTLVSHPWMAQRFRDYLTNSAVGPDMLRLLRGVTGIVISYEVRPSFYWSATGAIYLDADNFWLTPLERDTLNEAPDYRSNFGNDLQFIVPWRYVKNNEYYPAGSYPVADRLTRTFSDLEADISWLMYHELGHANDFFPPNTWASMPTNLSPLAAINRASQDPDSDQLARELPLRSDQLKALAQVNFGGADASDEQVATTAITVADDFANDVATSFYAFYTTREDYALLFEKFMMKYRLDADSDIAVLATRAIDPSLRVVWGQRNRFNDPAVQDRVLFAVERILPELDATSAQQSLPAPLMMDTTASWFDNLVISSGSKAAKRHRLAPQEQATRLRQDTMRHTKHHQH